MSSHWIRLVPEDPNCIPDAEAQTRARDLLLKIVPKAQEVSLTTTKSIEFFDCGEHNSRIACPACQTEIPRDWWLSKMNADYSKRSGFKMATYPTPCCRAKANLNQLVYDSPQGFARFSISFLDPGIVTLPTKNQKRLENALGTPLRVIYQHL